MEASGNSLLCKSTYVFLYGREYLPLMGYLCTLSLSNTCNIILKMFWSKNISFWNFWEIFQMKTLIPHKNWNPALSGVFFCKNEKQALHTSFSSKPSMVIFWFLISSESSLILAWSWSTVSSLLVFFSSACFYKEKELNYYII